MAEGWRVIGFDIEQHVYGEHRYPAQLVLQDVRTLHGRQSGHPGGMLNDIAIYIRGVQPVETGGEQAMKVNVIYNGMRHEIKITKASYGGALMDLARGHFSPSKNVGALGLFGHDGAEIAGNRTLAANGIKDGDELLLRPLVIR
ncbi:MAG: hypothetical protein ACREDR_38195 [Blastocatellia bacterium]